MTPDRKPATGRARRIVGRVAGLALLVVLAPFIYALLVVVAGSIAYGTNGEITVAGATREYLLHVPARYDPAKPTPLVISLHPAMSWPEFQSDVTGWNRLADEEGFIVAYPAGQGLGARNWTMEGWGNPRLMPDVRFVSALIDKLRAAYNIDPARIYANGLSNGGGMAYVLSCTLPHRIAAIGAVAAAQALPSKWCADATPVPMIADGPAASRSRSMSSKASFMAPHRSPSCRAPSSRTCSTCSRAAIRPMSSSSCGRASSGTASPERSARAKAPRASR